MKFFDRLSHVLGAFGLAAAESAESVDEMNEAIDKAGVSDEPGVSRRIKDVPHGGAFGGGPSVRPKGNLQRHFNGLNNRRW